MGKEISPFHICDFSPNVAGPGQQKLEQNHPFPLPAPLYACPSKAWSRAWGSDLAGDLPSSWDQFAPISRRSSKLSLRSCLQPRGV